MTQFLMRMRFSGSSHSYGERHGETQSVCVRERERERATIAKNVRKYTI